MKRRTKPEQDPVTFILVSCLIVSLAALLSALLYGALQLQVLGGMSGKFGRIQEKIAHVLPILLWGGLGTGALSAFLGWWRVRRSGKGGGFLFCSLVIILGYCASAFLHIGTLRGSLAISRTETEDARKDKQDYQAYVSEDIGRQRESIRGELAESDRIRAQIARTLKMLSREDAAFKSRDDLITQLEKLNQSVRGRKLKPSERDALESELARLGADGSAGGGGNMSMVVLRILERLKLEQGAYRDNAALMADLQKLHAATKDGAMSYPEMVTVERELKRLFPGGKPQAAAPRATPLPTPKAGPSYADLKPTPRPTPTPRPQGPPPVPANAPGIAYENSKLGFYTRFPQGWRVNETAGMVIASSPVKDPRRPVRASASVLKLEINGSPVAIRDGYMKTFMSDAVNYQEIQKGEMPLRSGKGAFIRCAYEEMGEKKQAIIVTASNPTGGGYLMTLSAPFAAFSGFENDFMIPAAFFTVKP